MLGIQYLERSLGARFEVVPSELAAEPERFASLDDLIKQLQAVAPERRESQLLCGHWLLRGELDRAERVAKALLGKDAKDAEAGLLLARIRGEQGNRAEQVAIAQAAAESLLGQSDARARWLAGLLLREAGRIDEAVVELVYAERGYRDGTDAERMFLLADLGSLYVIGRTEDGLAAIECFREALKINDHLASARCGLARTQLYREDPFKAEEEVDALARVSGDPEALTLKARFRIADGLQGRARSPGPRAARPAAPRRRSRIVSRRST
ncbi:MAG: hypothetical protein U1E76_10390 [Planctomycetota bacterium]